MRTTQDVLRDAAGVIATRHEMAPGADRAYRACAPDARGLVSVRALAVSQFLRQRRSPPEALCRELEEIAAGGGE